MTTGILLINLGTPKAPTRSAVKTYLDEFLMDPYVVDIPFIFRWLLVKGIILNTRPKQSAHAYQQIWTQEGSPLLVNSEHFATKLQAELPKEMKVVLAMRYGSPSLAESVQQLVGCDHVIVFPVFPQYSLAATASALDRAKQELSVHFNMSQLTIIPDFYSQSFFIQSWVNLLKEHYQPGHHLLFSYHGLPEKQVDKVSACRDRCSRRDDCPSIGDFNQQCYRAQCYASTRAIAGGLGLNSSQYTVAFQSRLGKIPWIRPYTDDIFDHLRAQGVTRLQVVCPSFVADCLETLEEIGMRGKEQWLSLSGDSFGLIPCLNDREDWVSSVAQYLIGL